MITLLLADDHKLFRQALRRVVDTFTQKYEIIEASNGREALEVLKEQRIDLLLLDIQMPVMNGIDVCKEIKRLQLNTRIIVLTMLDEAALVIHLLQIGVNGFLLKNTELEELENALEKTLTDGEYHSDFVSNIMKRYLLYPEGFANLNLSPREFQLLELIKQGHSNKEIATHLKLELQTIESYRKTLMNKTKCRSTGELVSFAHKIGINPPRSTDSSTYKD